MNHLKTTFGWWILHLLFSILTIALITYAGVGISFSIFPMLAYPISAIVAFVLHGLVFRLLNHMGYISTRVFLLGILLPIISICVGFGFLFIYYIKTVAFYLATPCMGISFVAWLIAYLMHAGKCKACGTSGFCIYGTKTAITGKEVYEYAYISDDDIHYGKDENREYTYKYKCKCCGNYYEKTERLEGISLIRKIKDSMMHDDKTK